MTPEAARLLDASRERLTDATAILGMGIYYVAARGVKPGREASGEAVRDIARSYNVHNSTISRVAE